MADFVGAVDQGTTSTRFMVFDHSGAEVARHQLEHTQVLPRPGWVEHNPVEIWERTCVVIETVLSTRHLSVALRSRASRTPLLLITHSPIRLSFLLLGYVHRQSSGKQ